MMVFIYRYVHLVDLAVKDVSGKYIDDILVTLASENIVLRNAKEPTCLLAPFIHPDVEASEHSIFHRKLLLSQTWHNLAIPPSGVDLHSVGMDVCLYCQYIGRQFSY